MEKMKIVGEIKHKKSGKRVIVTEEDVDDIMCAALEGGIVYWCNSAKVPADKMVASWGHEQIARGGELKIHVCEPFDDEDTEWYTLNKEKFMKGLEMYLQNPGYECLEKDVSNKCYTIDTTCIDAGCADMIIQYALFGEEVFG